MNGNNLFIIRPVIYNVIANILPFVYLLFKKDWDWIFLFPKYLSPSHNVLAPTGKYYIRRARICIFSKTAAYDFPINMREIVLDTAAKLIMNFLSTITVSNLKHIAIPPF